MATPLIAPIKNQGGTFYTFSSASEDFNFYSVDANKTFTFSKFVLLNLPNVKDGSNGENVLGLEHIPGSYLNFDSSNYNSSFAESFQNYCLNFEQTLIIKDTYDASKISTVSERVFWKWLKELGAIRFREAQVGNPENGGERTRRTEDNLTINNIANRSTTGQRFVEEDNRLIAGDDLYPYQRTVKYIGNVSAVNGVKHESSSFVEVYIHIPTDVGHTPTVLFKSISNDSNYSHSFRLPNLAANKLNREYLVGRSFNDEHFSGLSLKGFFDSDSESLTAGVNGVDSYDLKIKKPGETSFSSGWWFGNPEKNSYFTEPIKLNDVRNDWLKIEGYRNSTERNKQYLRTRLDGIEIDFDLKRSYSDNLSGEYATWEDYNKSSVATDFEWNAMLLYYDLEDKTTGEIVTNLYGVYFVNKLEDTNTDGYEIKRYKKFKPSNIGRQNGNAMSFKINFKHDLNANDNTSIVSVNEYNTFSMHLYLEALNLMKKTHSYLVDNISGIQLLSNKVDAIEDLIANGESLTELSGRLDSLETSFSEAGILIQGVDSIMSLINRNYDEIMNIYKNKTSVMMNYNLDILNASRGIELDKTVKNKVKLKAKSFGYSLSKTPLIDINDISYNGQSATLYYTHELQESENYLKVVSNKLNPSEVFIIPDGRKFAIFLDDSKFSWEDGQTVRIVFGSTMRFKEGLTDSLCIYTDSKNKVQSIAGIYSVKIANIPTSVFMDRNGKFIMDIVCLKSGDFSFTYDII